MKKNTVSTEHFSLYSSSNLAHPCARYVSVLEHDLSFNIKRVFKPSKREALKSMSKLIEILDFFISLIKRNKFSILYSLKDRERIKSI